MTTTTPAASTPTQTPTATASPSAGDAMSQLSSNFSTFLTLLTTQLKNQDPTSPMDSNQFTQQLVQYSQVEQQIDTNSNLKTLISQGTSQAGTFAASYLGKQVSVTNGNASLTSGAGDLDLQSGHHRRRHHAHRQRCQWQERLHPGGRHHRRQPCSDLERQGQ